MATSCINKHAVTGLHARGCSGLYIPDPRKGTSLTNDVNL